MRRPHHVEGASATSDVPTDAHARGASDRSGAYRIVSTSRRARRTSQVDARDRSETLSSTDELPLVHPDDDAHDAHGGDDRASIGVAPTTAIRPAETLAATAPAEPASDVVELSFSPSPSFAAGLPSLAPPRGSNVGGTWAAEGAPGVGSASGFDDLDFLDGNSTAPEEAPLMQVEPTRASSQKIPRTVHFTPQPMEAVSVPAAMAPEPVAARHGHDPTEPRPSKRPQGNRRDDDGAAALAAEPLAIGLRTIDPRPGIVAFAGFGLVPEKLSELPSYALHVFARRRVLRAGLAVARTQRPRDVELYQAALAAADDAAVRKGLLLLVAMVIATLGVIALAFQLFG